MNLPKGNKKHSKTFPLFFISSTFVSEMENEVKLELTAKIADVFMRYGVRSVNMDDIARNLSVSKKTLYKYFKDKSDVVISVTQLMTEGEECQFAKIEAESENAIDEIIRLSEFANQMLKDMHPSVMFDLQKYYPESFQVFLNHKRVFVANSVEQNLLKGIKEGLYRDNIDVVIISRLYLSMIDAIWNTELFPNNEYSFAQIHLEMIRYHIRGMASPAGIEYLKKRISKNLPNL